jgi:hypothetical protein
MATTLNIDKSFIYSTGQIENDKPELGLLHYNSQQNYVQIFLNKIVTFSLVFLIIAVTTALGLKHSVFQTSK